VVTSIVVLAVVCSALAFVMMIALIGEIGPVRSTAITYVNPAVAVFAGVLFLSERLTIWKVLGLALVLGGSALATRNRRVPAVPLDPTVDEAVAEVGR
jgi:drug/metabolite transporter (DMT)-like permease